MLDYTWEILSLYTAPHENGLDNVVKKINWRFQVTDGQYYGDSYEVTELDSPSDDSYIQYDQLSEETIISWIKANRDYDDLVFLVNQRLEENRNPQIVEKNPPWTYPITVTGKEDYLVVIDDQPNDPYKVWGALKWDSGRINNGLVERGFPELSVPDNMTVYRKGLIPTNQPLVLSDRVKIYKVEYTPQPEFDELTQYKENLSWIIENGKVVGTYFVYNKDLDQVKSDVKEIARQKRNIDILEPSDFVISGNQVKIHTDPQSYLVCLANANNMLDNDTINWKVIDGWVVATKFDLLSMASFIYQKTQQLFNQELSLNLQIDDCSTVEEIRVIYNFIVGV